MKIWIALCLTWFFARMSFAAPVASRIHGQGQILETASLDSMRRILTEDRKSILGVLPLKKLTAANYSNIERAVKSMAIAKMGKKSASAISADLAEMIRTYSSFDSFLSGKVDATKFPIARSDVKLSKVESQVYLAFARPVVYPEISLYLNLVKEMNSEFNSRASFISREEQEEAQKECFGGNKLTLNCLYEKSLTSKLTNILNKIGMTKAEDYDQEEVVEAIIALITKGPSSKSIVAKELFFIDGAQYVLKNHSQVDLFNICLNTNKNFRYWQMESMTYCRAVWQKELGSIDMDPELEARFFRQVTKFDAPVMQMVQGLSHEVLAPKTGCAKRDKTCLEKVLKQRLESWRTFVSFSAQQVDSISKQLARNYSI